MAEKKPWTQEEDRLLKFVFETSKVTKWSHIAHRLQEEFSVKGRNGKQCKERYTSHIDPSHPKEDWTWEEEHEMFQLHNELGNKWAVIGNKLGGKSDNCVKNHFYSLLRKALRRINKVVLQEFKRQMKEIKPNILYRIVEVSEERFKLSPSFEKEFVCSSNELKNQLLDFSYDEEEEEDDLASNDIESTRILIDKINEFGINYKKRVKKERRNSAQEQDLLTPTRYSVKKSHSELDDSDVSSSLCNSEDIAANANQEEANRSKRFRRNSADTSENTLEVPGRIRTRANSQDGRRKDMFDGLRVQKQVADVPDSKQADMQVQQMLNGLQILQQDEALPPHPLMMKKETSKYSRFSDNAAERQQYRFFEESNIEMRILPQMSLGLRMDSQFEENIFH